MSEQTTRRSIPLLVAVAIVGLGVGALAGVAIANLRSPLEDERSKVEELRNDVKRADERLSEHADSFFALGEGDCFNTPPDTYDITGGGANAAVIQDVGVSPVDCSQPHGDEVTAIVPYEEGGKDYPGEDVLFEFGQAECTQRFADYVGVELTASTLSSINVYPSAESWDQGDHDVVCVAFTEQDSAGSFEDSGR